MQFISIFSGWRWQSVNVHFAHTHTHCIRFQPAYHFSLAVECQFYRWKWLLDVVCWILRLFETTINAHSIDNKSSCLLNGCFQATSKSFWLFCMLPMKTIDESSSFVKWIPLMLPSGASLPYKLNIPSKFNLNQFPIVVIEWENSPLVRLTASDCPLPNERAMLAGERNVLYCEWNGFEV